MQIFQKIFIELLFHLKNAEKSTKNMGLLQASSSPLMRLLNLGLVAICFMGKVRERGSVPIYRDGRWKKRRENAVALGR